MVIWQERNDDSVWRVKVEYFTSNEMTTETKVFYTDGELTEIGKYLEELSPVRIEIWLDIK